MSYVNSIACLGLTVAFLQLVGCASKLPQKSGSVNPSWTEGFTLASLLAEETTLRTQQDLKKLLALPWYAEITVQNTKSGAISLSNCNGYLSNKTANIRAQNDNEQSLTLIGRGDLNHDGMEDALLLLKDSINGGNYTNIRLFIVSVNPAGKWYLLPQN